MKHLLVIISTLLLWAGNGAAWAQSGDLEVVSIDPASIRIEEGKTTELILVVNQNGPDDLPTGSARVSIAIDVNFIHWVEPAAISDDCGGVWAIHTLNPQGSTPQIQIRNASPLVNRAGCEIRIPVKAVATGRAAITVTSTVFGPGVSDPNGINQGATGTLTVDQSLPVKLASFTVKKEASTAILEWATTEEVNSDYFEVLHSTDAKSWAALGSVESNKNSKLRNAYLFTHAAPLSGLNYYRLKMVDNDLSYEYSDIQSVAISRERSDLVKIYPNPVNAGQQLTIESAGIYSIKRIQLLSSTGVPVYTSPAAAGKHPINVIPVDGYAPGMYITRVIYEDGSSTTHKVILAK